MQMGGSQVSIKRRVYLLSVYLTINVLYIGFGGAAMYMLEHGNEVAHMEEMAVYVQEVNLTITQKDHLEELGVCTFPNHLSPHWTITGSAFFCFTAITTIGYGAFAPTTMGGRAFTALYSTPGIAIIGFLLGDTAALCQEVIATIVSRLASSQAEHDYGSSERDCEPVTDVRWSRYQEGEAHLSSYITKEGLEVLIQDLAELPPTQRPPLDPRLLDHVWRVVDTDFSGRITQEKAFKAIAVWYQVSNEVPESDAGSGKTIGVTWCIVVVWSAVWGTIYSKLEGWTLGEGMWFAYVSLTTIGFGDFSPDTLIGRLIGFIFLAVGLGLMGSFFGALASGFRYFRFWKLHSLQQAGQVNPKLLEASGIAHVAASNKNVEHMKKQAKMEEMRQIYGGKGSPKGKRGVGGLRDPLVSSGSGNDHETLVLQPLHTSQRSPRGGAPLSPSNQLSAIADLAQGEMTPERRPLSPGHAGRKPLSPAGNAGRGAAPARNRTETVTFTRRARPSDGAAGASVLSDRPSTSARCPNGHELDALQPGTGPGCSGHDTHSCDTCFFNGITELVFRCAECDFDMCSNCAPPRVDIHFADGRGLCNKGHPLLVWLEQNCYGEGKSPPKCDVCGASGLADDDDGYAHCALCQFDICASCCGKPRKKQMTLAELANREPQGTKLPPELSGRALYADAYDDDTSRRQRRPPQPGSPPTRQPRPGGGGLLPGSPGQMNHAVDLKGSMGSTGKQGSPQRWSSGPSSGASPASRYRGSAQPAGGTTPSGTGLGMPPKQAGGSSGGKPAPYRGSAGADHNGSHSSPGSRMSLGATGKPQGRMALPSVHITQGQGGANRMVMGGQRHGRR